MINNVFPAMQYFKLCNLRRAFNYSVVFWNSCLFLLSIFGILDLLHRIIIR